MRRAAHLEGAYRYWLSRDWSERTTGVNLAIAPEQFGALWLMLNPSTADGHGDDPTIRKCIGFTKRLGFESFAVANLFALRATVPGVLRVDHSSGRDIVGPKNDETIKALAAQAKMIICAWGAFSGLGPYMEQRIRDVGAMLKSSCTPTLALGYTKAGEPRHPLMMPYYAAVTLKPWPPEDVLKPYFEPKAVAP